MLHGHYGFNLADEGFFWYGSQQAAQGEIPGLDFSAYEPGRYYWAAALFKLIGDQSNKSARIASCLFGAMSYGAICGYLVTSQAKGSRTRKIAAITILATCLSVWTFPYYRVTDIVAPCVCYSICFAAFRHPTKRTAFFAGFACGMLMFFGRNHAAYTILALSLVNLWVSLREATFATFYKHYLRAAVGLCFGASPFAILALSRSDYLPSITTQWLDILGTGKTNLNLRWPWPWVTLQQGMTATEADGHLLVGLLFMSLFAIAYGGVVLVSLRCKVARPIAPEIAAMTATTAGYLHYATDRADLEHIGPASMGIILGVILWSSRQKLWIAVVGAGLVTIGSLRVALRQQSAYHCVRGTLRCDELQVDRQTRLRVNRETVQITLSMLKSIGTSRFLAVPAFPSLYALKAVKSPIWDIYAAWPRTALTQKDAIRSMQMEKISSVLISNQQFGGEASFAKTNPLIYSYIQNRYTVCRSVGSQGIVLMQMHGMDKCTREQEALIDRHENERSNAK